MIQDVLLSWRDFYIASAGATAVLLGLTFVGIAIHVERQGFDSSRRGLAVGSATSLVYALFASLLMLEPQGVPHVQGVGLIVIGVFGLISASAAIGFARRGRLSRSMILFQFVIPYVVIGLLLLAGIALAFSLEVGLWGAGAAVMLLIVAGVQSAWDLLFRFAPRPGVQE